MAGDPAAALLLLGIGFDGLSLGPASLPRIKWALRNVRFAQMRHLAERALACEDASALGRLLEETQEELGLAPAPPLPADGPAGAAIATS